MSEVIFHDNSQKVLSDLEKAVRRGLKAIGMTAEGYAKELTPVDTGRLRNSMTFAVSGEPANISSYSDSSGKNGGAYSGTAPGGDDAVYVGTNVEYAEYVEHGAAGRKAHHMLQQAATGHKDEYKNLMKESMENV